MSWALNSKGSDFVYHNARGMFTMTFEESFGNDPALIPAEVIEPEPETEEEPETETEDEV